MIPRLLVCLFPILLATGTTGFASWKLIDEPEKSFSRDHPGLAYAKRVFRRESDGKTATVQLSFFSSADFRLEVIDLGGDSSPAFPSVREALRNNGCPAGVNGGFFYPNLQPMGLVVAQGRRIHRFETIKLLSGVLYCDDQGIHLARRTAFADHPEITAMLQTGPYLIEHGAPVRGLSPGNPDRRTFIATDWRRNWALATCSALSLKDLAELLDASPSVTGWAVERAINLDGGSSSAFYFDRPGQEPDVSMSNWKRVRTVLGIVPKR